MRSSGGCLAVEISGVLSGDADEAVHSAEVASIGCCEACGVEERVRVAVPFPLLLLGVWGGAAGEAVTLHFTDEDIVCCCEA